jgi:hypothetical protein
MQGVARTHPEAIAIAAERLETVGLAVDFESALGQFAERLGVEELAEAILERHERVQAAKGKRPWFERDESGFAVRGIGRLDDPFMPRVSYLHPYRVYAVRSFARDLQPAVSA